ncbi:hypothetical protein HYC85_010387 [Camellia sinensis]|uniref:Uncharacterized protein n=1 Tax=Camellia sinensis TaxID=4442 RepID=A0A7J7HHY2_CAMSI|nr:hypothetical protein HYC85_010387 [Camellia sinensis]
MTASMVTKEVEDKEKKMMTMQPILLEKYRKVKEAPRPVDERVVIRKERERKYGVVKFGGAATEEVVVRKWLERDGYKVIGEFLVARCNPPWTLPAFRTNEVLLPIKTTNPETNLSSDSKGFESTNLEIRIAWLRTDSDAI